MFKILTKVTNSTNSTVVKNVCYLREREVAEEYVEGLTRIVNSRMDKKDVNYTVGVKWKLESDIELISDKTIIEDAPLWLMKELLLGK